MPRLLLFSLLMTIATTGWSAEIRGVITLRNVGENKLQAGYVGRSQTGEEVHCFAGLTTGGATARVWCDTYRPRRSAIFWDPSRGSSFVHTSLPPGRYLVYARYGENFLTWRLVELKSASEIKSVTLACDLLNSGDLQVQINRPPGLYNVQVVPLDARGNTLFSGIKMEFHLGSDADSHNNVAALRGLAAGKYRLELRSVQRQTDRGGGVFSVYNDVGSWTVTVKARNLARYRLP
jgi:hypothetical protein